MKRTKLSDIASLTVGFVGTMAQHYVDSGIPFLRSLNIKPFYIDNTDLKYISASFSEELSKSILHENDIVIVRTGVPGTCCVVPKEYDGCNCADVVIVHPDFSKVNPYYLAAYINIWGQKQILNNKVGAIQQHFNVHTAEEMLVFLPDKETQDHVANLICSVNEKIQVNERLCAELEAMAKTLYDYWFVQFDFPDENGKPYRTSGGAMEWCQELGREVPKGWNVGILSDIANITMGQSPAGESYNENGEGMMFFQGSTDFGSRFPMPRVYTTAPTRFAKTGDILMSVRAPVGALNIAMEDCCIGRGLAALNSKIGSQIYLIQLLNNFRAVLDSMNGNGTTFGSINKDTLHALKIIIPPNNVLQQFEMIITPIEKQIRECEKENQELSTLRDWLLPMMMNGQARIKHD